MDELEGFAEAFTAFVARFAPLFHRTEPRTQWAKYLRGLLAPVPRKNSWQLAEAVGDAVPDRMQRLLNRAHWEADQARDALQTDVVEELGDPEAIGIIDETGFLKQGTDSVGVKRQYCGTAGMTTNCQVAVLLCYATPRGHTFLDRALYLPAEWCADTARRQQARVPEEITFQTKPELAVALLKRAWAQGVPMRWVTADEIYGKAAHFRAAIHQAAKWYVVAVPSNTPLWPEGTPPAPADQEAPPHVRQAPEAPHWLTVAALAASWAPGAWQRSAVADGEKGPRTYDWAWARIVESRHGLPDRPGWLLVRRSISEPADISYYLSNAPRTAAWQTLAQVASTRYVVEQCIKEGKGETGLDHYEVRRWTSWHRHLTLSMLAHAFLAVERARREEKGGRPSLG